MHAPHHARIALALGLLQAGVGLAWNPPANVTRLGAGADAGSACSAVDAEGRVHLLVGRNGQRIWSEVIEAQTCSPLVDLTSGTSPAMTTDSAGRAHAVYSLDWEIVYRSWNGAWSAGTAILSDGSGDSVKPWICADAQDNLHVVWSKGAHVWYNRRSATSGQWDGPTVVPGTSDLEGYFAPRVAAVGTAPVVLFGKHNGGNWNAWFATRESGAWVAALLDDGAGCSNGDIDVLPDGTLFVTWDRGYDIYARRRTGGTWSALAMLSGGAVDSTGPRVSAVSAGQIDWLWSQRPGEIWTTRSNGGTYASPALLVTGGNGSEINHDGLGRQYLTRSCNWDIWLSTDGGVDTAAPPAVSGATVATAGSQAFLAWTNPRALDLARVIVVVRTDRTPAGPADGMVLVDRAADWGADAFTHNGLSYYARYYYAIFVQDVNSNTSAAATLRASGPVVRADLDGDGDVDQSDFGILQLCCTGDLVPQTEPACSGAKLDGDSDVDGDDVQRFLACLGGPGIPARTTCIP